MKPFPVRFAGLVILLFSLALPARAQNLSVTNGLQLWLKADAGVKTNNAGGVIAWADQSPNHNDAAQTDDTAAPVLVPGALNGNPTLRFDGVKSFMDVADAPSIEISGDISTFFVVKFSDFATYRAVWAKTLKNLPAPNDYYLLPNTGVPRGYRGNGTSTSLGSVDGTTAIHAGNFVVLGWQMGGTTYTHYLNGQAIGAGEITATLGDGGTPLKIGTRDDSVTRMKGDIAEIVIFDRSLTASERSAVVTYLQTKYGIVNQPPTVSITSPANNASVAAPGVISFAANAADPDGLVSKVDFFANGARVGTATAAPYKVQLRVLTPGPLQLVAVATDNKDATAKATNSVTITGTVVPASPVTNNLALWLKADAGVSTGANGAVTSWKDQSGNGNDAVAAGTDTAPVLEPNAINTKPALLFDGVGDYLDVASSPSVAITNDIASFFVVRFTDFASFRAVWGKTEGNVPRPTDYYLLPGSGVPRVFRGGDNPPSNVFADGAAVPAGSYSVLGFNQAGTTMTHYFNGNASGSGKLVINPTDSGTPLKIGSRDDFVTKMKGEIAEVLLYNGSLSDDALSTVSAYLGGKYGIPVLQGSNSLPVVNITAPVDGLSVSAPTNLTVTATATDADGSIVKLDFFANGGLVASSAKAPFKATFLVPVGGDVVLTAVATDNLGGTTTSKSVTVKATAKTPSPLPVTNTLALWLRADAGVITNSTGQVTSWVDFSGNFNNAVQPDASAAPTLVPNGLNQRPTIRFNGSSDFLEAVSSPSLANMGDISTFFVVKFDDFTGFQTVWAKTSGNLPAATDYYLVPNTGVPRLIRGGPGAFQNVDGDPLTAGTFSIAGYEMAGTSVTHYLDGAASASGDITSTLIDVGSPLRIGTRGDSFTRLKGELAELLIFNSALSDADRASIAGYLHDKYFSAAPSGVKFTSAKAAGASVQLQWTGGTAPYLLQRRSSITSSNWMNVLTTSNQSAVVLNDGASAFFRVSDSAAVTVLPFSASLTGAAERPTPVNTTASGAGSFSLTGTNLSFNIVYSGLSGVAIASHIHGITNSSGSAAPIIDMAPFNGGAFGKSGVISGTVPLSSTQIDALNAGLLYFNIHTHANPAGEIRGQIGPVQLKATLNGANERPTPVNTPATGSAALWLTGNQLTYTMSWSGLSGNATASHIHGPGSTSESVAVLVPIPGVAGATSGTVSGSMTLTPDQVADVIDGRTYLNIHTPANPTGEIRGQITP